MLHARYATPDRSRTFEEVASKVATAESPTSTGEVVQAWVSPDLARELKLLAEQERRSVSAVMRLAVEDQLRKDGRHP